MPRKDLTGMKFNHWTVLKLDEEKSNRRSYWICQCDCDAHTIKSVRSDGLTSGHSKSCGCENRRLAAERMKIIGSQSQLQDDLTGRDFGYWHVIQRAENQNGHVAWLCKCKCGTEKIVLGQSLKNGASQSCGCLNMSHGEYKIAQLLTQNKINYQTEYSIPDIFENKQHPARFDFYVNNQYFIEFDGQQHYQEANNDHFRDTLEERQEKDRLKNQYCFQNNIPLIRIPYTHLPYLNIKDLLLETSEYIIKEEAD